MTWLERFYRAGRLASIAAVICLVVFSSSSSPAADIVAASVLGGAVYVFAMTLYVLDDYRKGRR